MNDTELIEKTLDDIAQFGNGKLEFETPDIERICRLAQQQVEKLKILVTVVIKSMCIAPKGECDRKPEDVCKECEGCKYLQQTVL